MTEYNGHPSWNHWNAALWVLNDEGLYTMALGYDRDGFIELMTEHFGQPGRTVAILDGPYTTPDGCEFTRELAGYAWDQANDE